MAKIVLPYVLARSFADGVSEHQVEAADPRQLVHALDERFPGIGERLNDGFAIAIDGEIFQDWFLERIGPESEVYFIPAIEGG